MKSPHRRFHLHIHCVTLELIESFLCSLHACCGQISTMRSKQTEDYRIIILLKQRTLPSLLLHFIHRSFICLLHISMNWNNSVRTHCELVTNEVWMIKCSTFTVNYLFIWPVPVLNLNVCIHSDRHWREGGAMHVMTVWANPLVKISYIYVSASTLMGRGKIWKIALCQALFEFIGKPTPTSFLCIAIPSHFTDCKCNAICVSLDLGAKNGN